MSYNPFIYSLYSGVAGPQGNTGEPGAIGSAGEPGQIGLPGGILVL